jgi:hypothetical protein
MPWRCARSDRRWRDASVRTELLADIARATGGELRAAPGELPDAPLLDPPLVEVGRSKDAPLWDRWGWLVALAVLLGRRSGSSAGASGTSEHRSQLVTATGLVRLVVEPAGLGRQAVRALDSAAAPAPRLGDAATRRVRTPNSRRVSPRAGSAGSGSTAERSLASVPCGRAPPPGRGPWRTRSASAGRRGRRAGARPGAHEVHATSSDCCSRSRAGRPVRSMRRTLPWGLTIRSVVGPRWWISRGRGRRPDPHPASSGTGSTRVHPRRAPTLLQPRASDEGGNPPERFPRTAGPRGPGQPAGERLGTGGPSGAPDRPARTPSLGPAPERGSGAKRVCRWAGMQPAPRARWRRAAARAR